MSGVGAIQDLHGGTGAVHGPILQWVEVLVGSEDLTLRSLGLCQMAPETQVGISGVEFLSYD